MQQRRGEVLVRSSTSPRVRLPFTCSFAEMFAFSAWPRHACLMFLFVGSILFCQWSRDSICFSSNFLMFMLWNLFPSPLTPFTFPRFLSGSAPWLSDSRPITADFWSGGLLGKGRDRLAKVASRPSRKAPDTKASTGLHQRRITAHLKAYRFLGHDSKQGTVMRDTLALF